MALLQIFCLLLMPMNCVHRRLYKLKCNNFGYILLQSHNIVILAVWPVVTVIVFHRRCRRLMHTISVLMDVIVFPCDSCLSPLLGSDFFFIQFHTAQFIYFRFDFNLRSREPICLHAYDNCVFVGNLIDKTEQSRTPHLLFIFGIKSNVLGQDDGRWLPKQMTWIYTYRWMLCYVCRRKLCGRAHGPAHTMMWSSADGTVTIWWSWILPSCLIERDIYGGLNCGDLASCSLTNEPMGCAFRSCFVWRRWIYA